MSFHIGETTVSFPLDRASGQELAEAISGVMATFADKAKAERPKRWPAMEFACTGEWLWARQSRGAPPAGAPPALAMRGASPGGWGGVVGWRAAGRTRSADGGLCLCAGGAGSELGGGLQKLEVYCNPNAHPTAFDAKVLISLQTREGVAVTTEGKLSAVRADVEAFIEAAAK